MKKQIILIIVALVGLAMICLLLPYRSREVAINPVTGRTEIMEGVFGIRTDHSVVTTPFSSYSQEHDIMTSSEGIHRQKKRYSVLRVHETSQTPPAIAQFTADFQTEWLSGRTDREILAFLHLLDQSTEDERRQLIAAAILEALESQAQPASDGNAVKPSGVEREP